MSPLRPPRTGDTQPHGFPPGGADLGFNSRKENGLMLGSVGTGKIQPAVALGVKPASRDPG